MNLELYEKSEFVFADSIHIYIYIYTYEYMYDPGIHSMDRCEQIQYDIGGWGKESARIPKREILLVPV